MRDIEEPECGEVSRPQMRCPGHCVRSDGRGQERHHVHRAVKIVGGNAVRPLALYDPPINSGQCTVNLVTAQVIKRH